MPRSPRKPAPQSPPALPEEGNEIPRVARRNRRRERSRAEIVEAARAVLLREGISGTTLSMVAREVGLTKAALYYYFPSKDALLFEVVYGIFALQAQAVHDAVEQTQSGGDALGAIIRQMVQTFTPRMDDFRLAFLHAQVAGPGSVQVLAEQLARIRPLNDLAYAGAAVRLAHDGARAPGRAEVEPRLMAFLAAMSAIGLLTMKGMVESADDPLLYSDEQLVEGLARIFAAATQP